MPQDTKHTSQLSPNGGFPPIVQCKKIETKQLQREFKSDIKLVPLSKILEQRKVTSTFFE